MVSVVIEDMHPNALQFEPGQRFGRLAVVRVCSERLDGHIMWLCKCDCGIELLVRAGSLNRGLVQSCGCLRKEVSEKSKTIDLLNKKFGKLLVISKSGKNQRRNVSWNCICDCGRKRTVFGWELSNGDVDSCGCDNARKSLSTPNDGTKVCSKCEVQKPLYEFEPSARGWAGTTGQCKSCRSDDKSRNWLVWRYGITEDQYDEMYRNQKGKCAICFKPMDRLFVDHCHATNRVRGLLCNHCNTGLGMFGEDKEVMLRAIEYLKPLEDSSAMVFGKIKHGKTS